jgi:hypothetical protein
MDCFPLAGASCGMPLLLLLLLLLYGTCRLLVGCLRWLLATLMTLCQTLGSAS